MRPADLDFRQRCRSKPAHMVNLIGDVDTPKTIQARFHDMPSGIAILMLTGKDLRKESLDECASGAIP